MANPCGGRCAGSVNNGCGQMVTCSASCGLNGGCPCAGGTCSVQTGACECRGGPCL
ncbi:MAG: hypothetical protein KF850_21165 [Labilithrix sp.]|nr:hypothetical protein [Labilithrix sp.]